MKLKEMIIYNLKRNKSLPICSLIAFWGISLAFIIIHIATGETLDMDMNMYTLVTVVFFTVGVGMATTKIDMGLANGISRKTMFAANIITSVIYALIVAVVVAVSNIGFSQIDGINSYGKYIDDFQNDTHFYACNWETDEKLYEVSEEEYRANKFMGFSNIEENDDGVEIYYTEEKEINANDNIRTFNVTTVYDILLMFSRYTIAFAFGWLAGALFKLMSKTAKIITFCLIWGINIACGIAVGFLGESGVDLFETGFGKFLNNVVLLISKIINWVHENFAHMMTWEVILCVIAVVVAFIPTMFLKPKKAQS